MKNYRKTRTSLKKTKFLSIWTAVFVFAASLVLIGCPNQASSPAGGSYITINYKSDELTVEKWDTAAKKWEDVTSGTAVDEGTELWFYAKNVHSGNMVDKWILNAKEKTPSRGNDLSYIVKAEDAVDEGGKKVIKVTRTFKPAAPIIIKYNSGEIEMQKWNTTSEKWEELPPNTPADEGSDLRFRVKNIPPGNIFDKWLLNGKSKKEVNYGRYAIKAEDAVEQADKKVIEITYSLKAAASITINYNSDELIVKKLIPYGPPVEVSSGTAVYEGTRLRFYAKDIPSGKMVEKWILNGKREVKPEYNYLVKTKDAVDEGDKKVIKVERILKDAALITINYNSAELTVTNTYNGTDIPSGTAVDEGTRLSFEAKNIPSGKTVDKWLLNGVTTIATGRDYCFYTVKAEDADSANTITITRKLKDAALITINYNSDELTVKDTKSSTKINPGTAVYEGTNLCLAAKNIPPGKMIVKWKINSKEFPSNNFDGWYSVNAEDADSANTVTVTRILKEAASITIKYNSAEIIVMKHIPGDELLSVEVPSGTAVDEGSLLRFETKDGHSVSKWILNGEIKVSPTAAYQVDSKHAVVEDNKKVIKVTFE